MLIKMALVKLKWQQFDEIILQLTWFNTFLTNVAMNIRTAILCNRKIAKCLLIY